MKKIEKRTRIVKNSTPNEIGTFERLLDLYKDSPILSVVSDTWDLWKVCTEILPALKSKILAGSTKLVIRPDSGDPVDIICGVEAIQEEYDGTGLYYKVKDVHEIAGDGDVPSLYRANYNAKPVSINERKGVIELLWDVFGGTVNEQGYKVLDPHIGAIYGDSITPERAVAICERLKAKGFASTNIVLGIGSFTYQYNTRDTFGFAVKATYGEVEQTATEDMQSQGGPSIGEKFIECREIFKDPITDDGTKKSAKGLLKVEEVLVPDSLGKLHHSTYVLKDQVTKEEEEQGALELIFEDGTLMKETSLSEIRARLKSHKH